MSKFDEIMKGGWHSGSKSEGSDSGSKKSWSGLKGKGMDRFSGLMGKEQKSNNEPAHEHVSRPLATLKDPAAFGPPPKHGNYNGGAALPVRTASDRPELGVPRSEEAVDGQEGAEEVERQHEEVANRPKGPALPFRADTTGLSTANLPQPPVRRDGADRRSPAPATKPKPSLPPRLPPRQNSNPGQDSASHAVAEPPAHRGILNQGSLNRLGAAGIAVPAFGIGESKPAAPLRTSSASPVPPATVSSPSSQIPARNGTSNAAQLNELQSRFSRSGKSSPAPETPSRGTSIAQKQAALKTASSLRNNPSSISLSDARNAASTANNFRERHGDQVTAGWKSANKLNTKYGIADKVGQYDLSHVAPEERAPGPILMQDNTAIVKKAPPPPPKKKAGLAVDADAGEGPPPPLPLASKPKLGSTTRSPNTERQDLDLDLGSLWFAKSPITFPPPAIARLSESYASSSGWSSSGVRKIYTFTGIIRHSTDLSTTKIHLTWDSANPGMTVKAEQKHFPSPRKLSLRELEDYREQYSHRVARWCEAKMGQQVGNGECWTLADEALKAVAAEERAQGLEPCMSSQGLVHGSVLYSYLPPKPSEPRGGVDAAGVARGDIAQFLTAHFKRKDGMGESWAGAPDHTAVITHVEKGGVLRVVESNSGGVKRVKEGRYDFSELVKGEIRIFRVVGESWLGPLDPSWP
ncbi:MAG: hypothetical protein M1818_005723 [Claussenomyces sp. TS43310]|nr:MAG: hypothetical protein M1818_005723 [Claussenomyces sp. TS43310]